MTRTTAIARPASGRFVLRLEPELHAALRAAAQARGVSLNTYCVQRLAAHAHDTAADEGPCPAVRRAVELLDDGLVGVVAFGSWARGEAVDGSDVDVLVIVEPDVAVTRALYRLWDARPVQWGGRSVEPHFAHLPEPGIRMSGLWAEIARDGIVLFERGYRVSRHLIRVRARLQTGHVRRHSVFGQPYWVEEAADEES